MTAIAPIVELSDGELPSGLDLVQQLIDTVTAHPEVREPLLRALLTEDFLGLPERVSRLQESFGDFRDETRAEFGRVNARLDENTRAIADNTRAVRRLEGHVGRLRGAAYEDLCRGAITTILDGLLHTPVLADRERINGQLLLARRDRLITRDEYEDGRLPDIIARDYDDVDEAALLMVGECSITFNRGDVETAYRRAKLVERVTGVETQPFVVTHYDWPPEIAEFARQLQVVIIQRQSDEHADQYAD